MKGRSAAQQGNELVTRTFQYGLVLLLSFFFCASAIFTSFAQDEAPAPSPDVSPSSSPSPSPSPSPTPTPVTGLHQWGAVTLFHGLPSDRVHAIAQDTDGSM